MVRLGDSMNSESGRQKALGRAYQVLAIRPRSEDEMRRRLRHAGVEEAIIEEAIAHLKHVKLLDDQAFAANWTQSRMRFRPRSKRLVQRELTEKGVSSETADEATREIDDDDTALALATRRAELLHGLDRKTRVRRLSNYLLGRGFRRDTITRTLAAVLNDEDHS